MIRVAYAASVLLAAPLFALSPLWGAERSVAPDGKEVYACANERESHSGCYTHWVRSLGEKGGWGGWGPGWCPEERPMGGMCWGGGVAWWYWKGPGKIGDPVLRDFWVRDYANLDDPSRGPENPYGDAIKLPGKDNCYKAGSFKACMVAMDPSTATAKPAGVPLPFAPNPVAFAKYMSKQEWSGRQWNGKAEFLDLSGCDYGRWKFKRVPGSLSPLGLVGEVNPYFYGCKSGYAKQVTPMGVKVCEVDSINYWSPHLAPADDLINKDRLVAQNSGFGVVQCRYR